MSDQNSITENIAAVNAAIPESVTLVAVSKTKPNEDILAAYEADQRDFGENKVQDLVKKAEELPQDIRWHFIGHLQRNKVKQVVPVVHLIHGVDSPRLLKEIDKRAMQNGLVVNCLLQVHIAMEDTKFGFDKDELFELINSPEFATYENICIRGLMGMATNTDDSNQVSGEFDGLMALYEELKLLLADKPNATLDTLSMGMSGDYPIAITAGSNMIRVGSKIFGARNY